MVDRSTLTVPRVGFFLPQHPDLLAGETWDPETWSARFNGSEDAWITQTYLRLRAAGQDVRACGADDLHGIDLVVVHPAHLPDLLAARGRSRLATVVTMADKTYGRPGADFAITQNGLQPDPNARWIPHWPQSGLVPRDPDRTEVINVVYKGRPEGCHPALLEPSWRRGLADAGLVWRFDGEDAAGSPHPWSDYHDTDVVVALRPPDRDERKPKPASKLVNAWLAGVPAVVGPEGQYRELCAGPDDVLEVSDPDEALDAVQRIASDPVRYQRMVAAGRARAAHLGPDALVERWADALGELWGRFCARGPAARAYHRSMQWAYLRRTTLGGSARRGPA